MPPLATIAPPFVEMAHRIVWATVATVDAGGRPRTRVLHPIWDWDGTDLTGRILTSPLSPKAADLAVTPLVSLTYWTDNQDTCTADCAVSWDDTPEAREAGWRRFADAPPPVGYDPAIIPQWQSSTTPAFGVLRLVPNRLRLMPGRVMTAGEGELLTWRRP